MLPSVLSVESIVHEEKLANPKYQLDWSSYGMIATAILSQIPDKNPI